MPTPGTKSGPVEPRRRLQWRPLVRSLHRDLGYLAVGLTVVYALSGLAVNHIPDWDPSFESFRTVHQLGGPLPGDDSSVANTVLQRLHLQERPVRELYRAAPDQLEVRLDSDTLHVNPLSGRVIEEGQRPRVFLRAANWLHLNRGKKAWRLFADAYAIGLLCLALSGIFMLPGRNGIAGRGLVLVTLGIAIPVLYLLLSGGPERTTPTSPPRSGVGQP